MLLAGFYWYGAKRRSPGQTPRWLQRMLNAADSNGGAADNQCQEQSATPEDTSVSQSPEEFEQSMEEDNHSSGNHEAADTLPAGGSTLVRVFGIVIQLPLPHYTY